ncbi:MAG: ABC transporter substrate-binding protein [Candidatus Rokubacteria bacterium]|nr:ABC transporter substrate-binding protein [Candidatus Rokubacteria bacterium]
MRKLTVIVLALAVLGAIPLAEVAWAQAPGVTDSEILLCSYQPMTGKESTYFRMGKGADIWYKHVNEQGGVNGRKIVFKMIDDQYNPSRTTIVVKEFVERDKCFAIANPLGSAPTAAVIDYITENKVPLIGAGTGAAKNLEYPSKYVFPLYPSYHTEGQDLVRFAKEQLGGKTVSLLYQNDPSGKTHIAGVESALDKYGVKLVAKEPYEKNELDVSAQVIKMKAANPDVHLCSCAPEHAARFFTERQKLGWKVPVVVVFFGQSPKVIELAGKEAVEGVYFSTIFRRPNSPDPLMRQFVSLLKKYYPQEEPDAIHMWGYAGAQVVTEALRRMPKETAKITRDGFVDTLESIRDWKGSLIPVVNIGKGNAPDHFLIREMSWLWVKGGDFEVFTPKWMR